LQDPGVKWKKDQVYYPEPIMPISPYIGKQFRRYVTNFNALVVNVETVLQVNFDRPSYCYALSGAGVENTGAALPVGMASLDTFRVRFEHATGDRLDTAASLGSSLLGTGDAPALLGGPAWFFNNGSVCRIGVTILVANIDVDIVMWCIETPGPTNLTGGPVSSSQV